MLNNSTTHNSNINLEPSLDLIPNKKDLIKTIVVLSLECELKDIRSKIYVICTAILNLLKSM